MITRPNQEQRAADLARVQAEALALGVVGVHDFEGRGARAAFADLRARGELALRVTMGMTPEMVEREDWGELFEADEWLRVGPVKVFADGALGSRTAFLLEPYGGDPAAGRGLARIESGELLRLVRRARARGLGVAVHAIGDGAVRQVLDVFEQARSDPSPAAAGQILRVEHAQLVDPADLPRFAALGVVASMQPNHCPSDRPVAQAEWGARCRHAYAWRSLLESGATLAFGTDCPVEPLDPLANLYAAVTRRDPSGEPPGGWYPEQCLDLPDAIGAYTLGSALAGGDGWRRGSLEAGKLADQVVLSEPILGRPPESLLRARVDLTVIGGRIVFERG